MNLRGDLGAVLGVPHEPVAQKYSQTAGGEATTFATAFGSPITAPVAIADGQIYVPCEDGYLYVLGPAGKAPLPRKDLQLWKSRSELTGPWADAKFDWYTNYGDFSGSNVDYRQVAEETVGE